MKHSKLMKLGVALTLAASLIAQTATVFAAANTAVTTVSSSSKAPIVAKIEKPQDVLTSGLVFRKFEGNLGGVYSVDGEKGGLKLKYAPDTTFAANRVMIAFNAANKITPEHKYMRITYMTEDPIMGKFTVCSNASPKIDTITIVSDTSASKGQWVRSNAINIDQCNILSRLVSGNHVTFGYFGTPAEDTAFYIKEFAFFTSEQEAYDYYGDNVKVEAATNVQMTFGANGNAAFLNGDTYGVHTVNAGDETLDITWAEKTNQAVNYMAKIKFAKDILSLKDKYVRVVYSASMPTKEDGSLYFQNDKTAAKSMIVSALKDTKGEYVLSDVLEMEADTLGRLSGEGAYNGLSHCSLDASSTATDNLFKIKAIFFFDNLDAAKAFTYERKVCKLDINGNDISKYKIVISEDAPAIIKDSANGVASHISALAGVKVPVVTDAVAPTEYEILIGESNRPETDSVFDLSKLGGRASVYVLGRYAIGVMGNKLVVTARYAPDAKRAVNALLEGYLRKGASVYPEAISIDESYSNSGISTALVPLTVWDPITNVANPEIFTDDFSADEGYFTEENYAQNWNVVNGTLKNNGGAKTLTYLHVYEFNASLGAKWQYTDAKAGAEAGLMLRYTAENAWVRAGYDFDAKVWYIEVREGDDFYIERVASVPAAITPNTWYDLKFTMDGDKATLLVNGKTVAGATVSAQKTPGRIAFYADNATVAVDDATVTLLSGQGTIMKDVVHTMLPDEEYREGGTVVELSDGTLRYNHHGGRVFNSTDNGKTWQRGEYWTNTNGYTNILRLNNGDLLKIANGNVNGISYKISQTSSDDGKTWVDGGTICYSKFGNNTEAHAGNMNDKITQSGTTDRIFYSQNYEITKGNVDGRTVFCEFYYSDDNGKTWTKSETDSWELGGNEDQARFGECKILECADGTLRMYNSWNAHGCIVYSESTDNGVTWGPLVKMPEFVCACSSMQFVRDPYAENDTTYYMVWVNSKPIDPVNSPTSGMTRARLTLAKSTDGKNWTVLGDFWRWESGYTLNSKNGVVLNHIVDPFIQVNEDYIIAGTGLSEKMPVTGDHSYHGAQRQHIWSVPKASVEPGEKLYNFTDVTTKDDSYEAFKFCVDNGLFNGTSATTMGPKVNVSRAMFATVLGRLNGADMTKYTTPTFKDVVAGQWYTNFVEWAAANNVITGYPGGVYGINDNITVEQACLILARYNGFKAGKDGKTMADFTDAASVSSWAADGVKWAVESGVYEGSGTLLNPTAPASRALMAEMMYNYTTIFGK